MKHPYLQTYYPPIPCLQITLDYPDESLKLGPFTAIIDTGADGTMVPQSLLDEINAPFVDEGVFVATGASGVEFSCLQSISVLMGYAFQRLKWLVMSKATKLF